MCEGRPFLGWLGLLTKEDVVLKKRKRKVRNNLKRTARAILDSRYGVAFRYTDNYHAIHRYIKQFRPELKSDGYKLLEEFCGHPKNQYAPLPEGDFLSSFAWRKVRMEVLKRDGARCACCGASRLEGRVMHVDHIKPRKLFPALALDPSNLQVLCDICNHGKGNWDQTDWR